MDIDRLTLTRTGLPVDELDELAEALAPANHLSQEMITFGYRLRQLFQSNSAYRRPKELEWLESLRQYKGLYDPDVTISDNASKVYPKITRSKVNIVLSRLHQMLFPETEENWELSPTPEPRLSKDLVKQIAVSLIKPPEVDPSTGQPSIDPSTGQPSQPTVPTEEELTDGIVQYAKTACLKMSNVISDQFIEMDYPEETKKVLRSGLMYGTGIMKGPMISKRTKRRWYPTPDGTNYEESVTQEDLPDLEFVSIWDWYPDMSVVNVDKMNGAFQRHIVTKHDLRVLAKREDFYSDVILQYLTDHPSGDYVPLSWEVDLQVIEVEAGSGQQGTRISTAVSSPVIEDDSSRSTNRPSGKKYELLEFWGYIDGSDLSACGIQIDDPQLEYGANIWVLGGSIVKAVLFDTAIDQFKVFYYEKDETSIFGEGLARIMRHSQVAIASASRMVLDNGACVSGPNVEVNVDLIMDGTDYTSFYPRKIWFREGRGVESQYPALRSLQFDSHIPELLSVIDAFKQFADEETTLPTWMIGQVASNETAQATSGRMATITISIKDVVKNFDTFTENILRSVYAWNMEFNPRQDIKGDYNVRARGVQSLVMKEIRMQALTQMKSQLTPEDWVYIPHREYLEEYFKAHDVHMKLRSEVEAEKVRASMQDQRAMELAYKMQEAEIAYKKSQTMAQLTKAKEHNVKAIKDSQTPIENPNSAEDPRLAEGELSLQQTENEAKQAEIRRQEEKHALDLQHLDEDHRANIALTATKTAHEVANKDRMAQHGMEMKTMLAKAAAKAKKSTPKPAKPSKSPPKE
jgi:uncharacterized protein (DUF2344 family)